MLLIVVGGVIVLILALAALYDRRARRRGSRVGVSANDGLENRADVAATNLEPFVHREGDG